MYIFSAYAGCIASENAPANADAEFDGAHSSSRKDASAHGHQVARQVQLRCHGSVKAQ